MRHNIIDRRGELTLKQDERIERYILNNMEPDEANEFEVDFISDPECLAQLELTEKLYAGIQTLANNKALFARTPKPMPVWKRSVPIWSLAASIIFTVLVSHSFLNTSPSNSAIAPAAISVINVELAGLRGTSNKEINITPNNQQTVLSFYVDTDVPAFNFAQFEFNLTGDNRTPVYKSQALSLNNASTLFINLGKVNFKTGSYKFELYGIDKDSLHLIQSGELNIR